MLLGSGEKQIKCRATDVVSTDDRTGQFEWRLGGEVSISSTFRIQQLLHAKIPEAQKRHNQVVSFSCFWDLRTPKLRVEHWWNWHQVVMNVNDEVEIGDNEYEQVCPTKQGH